MKTSGVSKAELLALFDIAQKGFYTAPVLAHLLQRLKKPEHIADFGRRAHAYAVLATVEKNRGHLKVARAHAEAGLNIVKGEEGIENLWLYFLDQLGSIAAMEGDLPQARTFFEHEIALAEELLGIHPVGAYRGLAAVLAASGDTAGAQHAITKSLQYATAADDLEGQAFAALQQYEQQASDASAPLPDPRPLENIPTEHLIGRVMALNIRARAHLVRGQQEEGMRLLRLAYREAKRLQLKGQVDTALQIAMQFNVALC